MVIKNLIKSSGLVLLSRESTPVTIETSTCIDHFAVRSVNDTELTVLNHQIFADRFPVYFLWYVSASLFNPEKIYRDTSFLKNPV